MSEINKIIMGVGKLLLSIVDGFCYPILFNLYYHQNIWSIYTSYHRHKTQWKKRFWNRYMLRNAASISIDAQIASPLILPHGVSGIFITQSAVIGRNVVVFQQVTIGANTIKGSKSYGAPIIGNDVYIGAGAKIIGNAVIADNVRIGANAVVVKEIPYNALVVCGEPRIIVKEHILNNNFSPYLEKQSVVSS